MPGERLKHGHTDGNAHLDLLADDASRMISDRGSDLDASIHWARMHNQGIRFGARQLLVVEPKEMEELSGGRNE